MIRNQGGWLFDQPLPMNLNQPVIGWHNVITSANIEATTEDPDFPVTNLGNPATNQVWLGDVSIYDEYLTVTLGAPVNMDYIAIAAHNLGTAGSAVGAEFFSGTWQVLVSQEIPANDNPLILRFTKQSISQFRLRIEQGTEPPQIAVLYAGALLYLPRRIYVGHTPITYGRSVEATNGRAEQGNYLGRIITSERRDTAFTMSNIFPDFYRTYMDPFVNAAIRDTPFFFAWRPATYPNEVGYCWVTNNPQPVKPAAERNDEH